MIRTFIYHIRKIQGVVTELTFCYRYLSSFQGKRVPMFQVLLNEEADGHFLHSPNPQSKMIGYSVLVHYEG